MRLIESEINQLKHKVWDMAELVELQLDKLIRALTHFDKEIIRIIQKKEKKIDKFDLKIDKRCERIIALYQPVADDLRFVFSVLKVNVYLEQIGDNVESIARRINDLQHPINPKLLEELQIEPMLVLTKSILHESLLAFFEENAQHARSVFPMDDEIDAIDKHAYGVLVKRIKSNPDETEDLLRIIQISKMIEKIADLSMSISEEALFHIEGVFYKHSSLKHSHKEHHEDLPTT